MPIEIRELVIRANVEPSAGATGGCGTSSGSKSKDDAGKSAAAGGGDGDLVQECVREVLRILEARRER